MKKQKAVISTAIFTAILLLGTDKLKADSAKSCKQGYASSLPVPVQKESLCRVFHDGQGYCQIKFSSLNRLKYNEKSIWLKSDTQAEYELKSFEPEIIERPGFEFNYKNQNFRCWVSENSDMHDRAKGRFNTCRNSRPDFFFFSWNKEKKCSGIY